MSVWKGSQLIAANGSPGNDGIPGPPGRDGINGNGVLVVSTCTEIHNNMDYDNTDMNSGHNEATNAQWCQVGGYHSSLTSSGQASEVFGYQCHLGNGEGVHVEGDCIDVTTGGQGAHVEGHNNIVGRVSNGGHIEGQNHDIGSNSQIAYKQGVHVEGHSHSDTPITLSDGAHVGGYGITTNSQTAPQYGTVGATIKTNISSGENSYIEAIGLKNTNNNYGNLGRVMRNDGCMAIKGDLTFTALNPSTGNPITTGPNADGRYTLGEIVQALIDAGILAPPL